MARVVACLDGPDFLVAFPSPPFHSGSPTPAFTVKSAARDTSLSARRSRTVDSEWMDRSSSTQSVSTRDLQSAPNILAPVNCTDLLNSMP